MYISCALTMRPLAFETEQVPLTPNFWEKVLKNYPNTERMKGKWSQVT